MPRANTTSQIPSRWQEPSQTNPIHPLGVPSCFLPLQAHPMRARRGPFAWKEAPAAALGAWRCCTTGPGARCVTMDGASPRARSCAGSWAAGRCCRWHRALATAKGRGRSGWTKSTAPGRKRRCRNAGPGRGESTTVTTLRTPALSAQVPIQPRTSASPHPSRGMRIPSPTFSPPHPRFHRGHAGHPPVGQWARPLRREGGGAARAHVGHGV